MNELEAVSEEDPAVNQIALELPAMEEWCDSGLSPFPGSLFKYFF